MFPKTAAKANIPLNKAWWLRFRLASVVGLVVGGGVDLAVGGVGLVVGGGVAPTPQTRKKESIINANKK